MSSSTRLFRSLSQSTKATSHLSKRNLHSQATNRPKLTSAYQIFKDYFTEGDFGLKLKGHTPESLFFSGVDSFHANHRIRAQMQLATMLRITPEKHDAAFYEKSGDFLFKYGYTANGMMHYEHAFKHMHRPYYLTERLGHQYIVQNQPLKALGAFEHQVAATPRNPVAHNELGVAHYLQATQQLDPMELEKHVLAAIKSFKKSSELKPENFVAFQNQCLASQLNITSSYQLTAKYFTLQSGMPTSILKAIEKFGHERLSKNDLLNAQKLFELQVMAAPEDPLVLNELGIVLLMQALQQTDFTSFEDKKIAALNAFKKAAALNPQDDVAPLNVKVASLLTLNHVFGEPARDLKIQNGALTTIADAIKTDLKRHSEEYRSDTALGFTLNSGKEGSSLSPTFTSFDYKVPRFANQKAIDDIEKAKAEAYENKHSSTPSMRR